MSSIFLFASFKRAKAIQSRRPLSLLTRWRVQTKHDFHFTANLHGGGGGERYIFSLEKDARQRPSPEREKKGGGDSQKISTITTPTQNKK
jgi:hypothetical protein